ncbi:MAG: TetR/AcrR family transcriptional regulator [Dethiobacter sp.]|nr:TetR/AcrR family transcriptional regulator [Dethiobacter sp.]
MEDTRNRILKAALESFSKHGYTGATTREIARVSEVTEVTLFRYFQSKEKLFENVVCKFLPGPEFGQFVSNAKELDYRQALESIAHFFLEGLKQNEDLIRILYMESQRHYELMEQIYSALINNLNVILADYFTELQGKNIIRRFDPSVGAKMFLGIWIAFYEEEHLFAIDPGKVKTVEAVRECIEIFVRGTQA